MLDLSPNQHAVNEKKLLFENVEEQLEALDVKESVTSKQTLLLNKLKFTLIYYKNSYQEFLLRFPLLIYALKRIFFAMITLILAVSVIFVLLRLVTPDSVYLSDIDLAKLKITVGSPAYNFLLTERMKIFGVYGSI